MPRGVYKRKKAKSNQDFVEKMVRHAAAAKSGPGPFIEHLRPVAMTDSERQELETYRTFFKILARVMGG